MRVLGESGYCSFRKASSVVGILIVIFNVVHLAAKFVKVNNERIE